MWNQTLRGKMKNIIICLSLVACSLTLQAQIQHRLPVTQTTQECTSALNGTGAAVGAGAGYVAGRLLLGKKAGLLGAATGGLIGANTNNQKSCVNVDKIIGYKVITVQPDGSFKETFEAAK